MKTLQHLFLDELMDMYDAEHRILLALPKLAHAATCPDLRDALEKHQRETEGHVAKIEQVFAALGKEPKAKKCQATIGLLEEGDEIVSENKGSPTLNAAIISAGQKVEHYEIASYGCLQAWAKLLGNQKSADLIGEILAQEKAADEKLGELAGKKNEEALGHDKPDEHDAQDRKPEQGQHAKEEADSESGEAKAAGSDKRPAQKSGQAEAVGKHSEKAAKHHGEKSEDSESDEREPAQSGKRPAQSKAEAPGKHSSKHPTHKPERAQAQGKHQDKDEGSGSDEVEHGKSGKRPERKHAHV